VSVGLRRAAGLATVLAVVALCACGRRGPPLAPEVRMPQAVSDLAAIERGGGVELSWTAASRRIDNSRILEPGVARLYRADDAGTGEPRAAILAGGRVRGYTEIASFRLQDAPSSGLRGNRITYVDRTGLVYDRRYTYVATTSDAQGRTSAPSTRVSITYIALPEPPQALRGAPGDRATRLQWQPPEKLVDGTAISDPLVYEVLRATDPVAEPSLIGRTAPGVTAYEDRSVDNDRTYYYAVRAVRTAPAASAAGAASERVSVTPTKMTPPASVEDVTAVPSRGEVRLSWRPSPEPDVATYIVYRAARGGTPGRIGTVRPPVTTFVDRNVPPGTYRYTVTAQDASARANESAPSNEVSVTVP
jgi:fibronectin type 3 domain-containing protein